MDYVWFVLLVAAMAGLWWLAYKIEPHYSHKDGRRFLCLGQEILDGKPVGRQRETHVVVMGDGSLYCTQKKNLRRDGSTWTLIGKSPAPPKNREVYLLQKYTEGSLIADGMALKIPANSRVVPVLEAVLERRNTPGS